MEQIIKFGLGQIARQMCIKSFNMSKRIFSIVFMLSSLIVHSQTDSIAYTHMQQKIEQLQAELKNQKNDFSKKIETANDEMAKLRLEVENEKAVIAAHAHSLDVKIEQTEIAAKDSISKLDKNVIKNRLYWIIATLATLLLGGIIYWLLGKRILNSKTDVEAQIKNAKIALEKESLKLDSKLVEVLESQLKLKQEEKQIASPNSNNENDHSLALKVADEIVRMQKNISKMVDDTKGLKPLIKGIERIQVNFASNGYETVNLLNKDYDERMNIDVINFITDENLLEGKKVITAVIKPQVNYNGVLILRAQVDVSQN